MCASVQQLGLGNYVLEILILNRHSTQGEVRKVVLISSQIACSVN